MYASIAGNIRIVEILLQYGANPTMVTNTGAHALALAESNDHYDVATLIRSALPPNWTAPAPPRPQSPLNPQQRYAIYTGTGWLTNSGYIVTNYHVIEGQIEVRVRFNSVSDETHPAKVVVSDKHNDLAILELKEPGGITARGIPVSSKDPAETLVSG
jgi:S1-C subfamily serine protease